MNLSPEDQAKQIRYRDARFTNQYDDIWQTVGKCVFCDLNDRYVFFEENGVAMTVSLYAYIDGHFMIVPRRHVRSPKDLSSLEWETIRKFTYIAKKLIRSVHHVNGVQFIDKEGLAAQSTVTDHWHLHCVPFDTPDLAVWNYRKLKYTPLQNVSLYRRAAGKIQKYNDRFAERYSETAVSPVACDVIIVSDKQEVLFEKRTTEAKVGNDWITPPGGSVDNFKRSLEQELAREVKEEIGVEVNPAKFQLISSRLESLTRYHAPDESGHQASYIERLLINTYLLTGFDSRTVLTPGDDAKSLVWVPKREVASHPRISDQNKLIISRFVK